MTLLLASVTGPDEAALALAHGADIIDLKDASKGALGALDPDVVRATVAAIGGRQPVSAVTGDPDEPEIAATVAHRRDRGRLCQGRIVPGPRRRECIRALLPLSRTKIVGVIAIGQTTAWSPWQRQALWVRCSTRKKPPAS
jgi:dihydroneopterin aldolase